MVNIFKLRNTNLLIIYYYTIYYEIYLNYFKKILVLSKICVYLIVIPIIKSYYPFCSQMPIK